MSMKIVRGKTTKGGEKVVKAAVDWDSVAEGLQKRANANKAPTAFDQAAVQEEAWKHLKAGLTRQNLEPAKGGGPTTPNAMRNAMIWRVAERDSFTLAKIEGTLCFLVVPEKGKK